ncbi:LLM class flavin-dependent oxidoreductase [Kineosporia mesophila]|uniref:LLM class flavin-dependent oxidoreductase n=1 Tax=Kineosporia mesophila TaxID=566012 RepID=A0ABP6YWU3_9ACTN|nr:MsnO8 family LLM class oxidoreductase [Kineosporia mesophila]MCD5354288.1 MsnO8 family LLM class oxidoreductase [Kineosporia mesophila]
MGITLSALEVAAAEKGRTAADALRAVGELVPRLDELGYQRLWFAEHHGSEWATSVVPAVLTAHFAALTSRIRLGSGGVMAPNHAPRAVAEQFATLGVLHPGRIDLGIGRGPGTHDRGIVQDLRRGAEPATDADYRSDVAALLRLVSGEERLISGPLEPVDVEPWLLSSSPAGARLAAELGLPLAFAHHIRPDHTAAALSVYREQFTASRWRQEPYVMLCVEALVAATDERAAELAVPIDQAKVGLLAGRGEAALLSPAEAATRAIPQDVLPLILGHTGTQVRGGVETAARRFAQIVGQTGADELMLFVPLYDAADRIRSFELAVTAAGALTA